MKEGNRFVGIQFSCSYLPVGYGTTEVNEHLDETKDIRII